MGNAKEKQNLWGGRSRYVCFGDSSEEPVEGSEGWAANKSLVTIAGQRNT